MFVSSSFQSNWRLYDLPLLFLSTQMTNTSTQPCIYVLIANEVRPVYNWNQINPNSFARNQNEIELYCKEPNIKSCNLSPNLCSDRLNQSDFDLSFHLPNSPKYGVFISFYSQLVLIKFSIKFYTEEFVQTNIPFDTKKV